VTIPPAPKLVSNVPSELKRATAKSRSTVAYGWFGGLRNQLGEEAFFGAISMVWDGFDADVVFCFLQTYEQDSHNLETVVEGYQWLATTHPDVAIEVPGGSAFLLTSTVPSQHDGSEFSRPTRCGPRVPRVAAHRQRCGVHGSTQGRTLRDRVRDGRAWDPLSALQALPPPDLREGGAVPPDAQALAWQARAGINAGPAAGSARPVPRLLQRRPPVPGDRVAHAYRGVQPDKGSLPLQHLSHLHQLLKRKGAHEMHHNAVLDPAQTCRL
jgi:hypothetical protein